MGAKYRSDADERAMRAQALSLAVHNREPGDNASGSQQVKRAECYLKFLKMQKARRRKG